MTDLDEALVRAGRYLRRGVVSADLRTLEKGLGSGPDRRVILREFLVAGRPSRRGWEPVRRPGS